MVIRRISFLLMTIAAISYFSCQKESFSTLKEPVLGMEFVNIQKGSFQHKINNDSSSEAIHQVHISTDFWLGRTEVTQVQWQQIMGSEERHPEKPSPFRGANSEYPVVSVSYFDIEEFLEKLNELSDTYHFRLPTEAEWEYVARAGSPTAYWWGDEIGLNNAVCRNCGSQWDNEKTAPIGSFSANVFELYDTAGNVWEWTQDCWHVDYQGMPVDGSAWLEAIGGDCDRRVVRGGSWGFDPRYLRSAGRGRGIAGGADFYLGFRVARDL